MLNEIFSSVFPSGTSTFSLGPFLACTVVSLLLGLLIAWTHTYRNSCTRSFLLTLVTLPAMVQVVIMLVKGSISLVRFRSVPGNAREIGSVFLAMAIGLATGMGYLAVAVLFTVLLCGLDLLLSIAGFGREVPGTRNLRITIPEGLDYEGVFDDLFQTYVKSWELESVKTANMGSLYRLCYRIVLKNNISEKAFLDDLRCRNGNLEISCSKIASNEEML